MCTFAVIDVADLAAARTVSLCAPVIGGAVVIIENWPILSSLKCCAPAPSSHHIYDRCRHGAPPSQFTISIAGLRRSSPVNVLCPRDLQLREYPLDARKSGRLIEGARSTIDRRVFPVCDVT
jgi:hypothetical protein